MPKRDASALSRITSSDTEIPESFVRSVQETIAEQETSRTANTKPMIPAPFLPGPVVHALPTVIPPAKPQKQSYGRSIHLRLHQEHDDYLQTEIEQLLADLRCSIDMSSVGRVIAEVGLEVMKSLGLHLKDIVPLLENIPRRDISSKLIEETLKKYLDEQILTRIQNTAGQ